MLKKLRRLLSDEDTAALAEFTLVTPVFMLVALAIVQLGYIMFLENNMHQAAQIAAQQIATGELVAQGSHVDCADGSIAGAERLVCDGLSQFTGNFTVSATHAARRCHTVSAWPHVTSTRATSPRQRSRSSSVPSTWSAT